MSRRRRGPTANPAPAGTLVDASDADERVGRHQEVEASPAELGDELVTAGQAYQLRRQQGGPNGRRRRVEPTEETAQGPGRLEPGRVLSRQSDRGAHVRLLPPGELHRPIGPVDAAERVGPGERQRSVSKTSTGTVGTSATASVAESVAESVGASVTASAGASVTASVGGAATGLLDPVKPVHPGTVDHPVTEPMPQDRVDQSDASTEAEPEESGAPTPARRSRTRRLWTSLARPTSAVVMASVVVGTAIRLDVPRGLWLDEAISVSEARMPYREMLHRLATTDVHPPLYFTFLWGAIRLFGHGELAVRAPSILFGVILIPLVYLLGKEAYDRKAGALASVIVAVAPFTVWYSQEARPYSQLMVFSVLALWAQLRILRRGGWFPWTVYAVSSVAMIASQYFGVWQLLTQQLIFVVIIVSRWRRQRRPPALLRGWLFTALPMVVALAPLALLMRQQFSLDQASGQAFGAASSAGSANVYSVIANVVEALLGFHSSGAITDISSFWPFAMLAALALLGRRSRSTTYLLGLVVVIPFVGMVVLSQFKESLADVRYLSTTVPVLLVLLARGITTLAGRRALPVVVGALLGVLAIGLVDQQYSATNPRRFDFREALQRVNAEARPGDRILFDPVNVQLNTVTTYYSPKISASPLTPIPTVATGHTLFIVASKTLMSATDRATLYSALGSLNFHHHAAQHWVFPNVEVWVYR